MKFIFSFFSCLLWSKAMAIHKIRGLTDRNNGPSSSRSLQGKGSALQGKGGAKKKKKKLLVGCEASPNENYTPLSTEYLTTARGPKNILDWPFNRGIAAITYNINDGPPNTLTAVQAKNGFSIASLLLNETASSASPYFMYNTSVYPNLLQDGSDVTALVWTLPYIFNESSARYVPVVNSTSKYFLLGSQAGNLWLMAWNTNNSTPTTVSQIASYGSKSYGVADILYVPQNNIVVVVDYYGYMRTYQIEYDQINYDLGPTITFLKEYENYQGLKDPTLPINLKGMYVDKNTTYIYACGLPSFSSMSQGKMVWFELIEGQELVVKAEIFTGMCYNMVFTIYGMYYLVNGNFVGFMEWAQQYDETAGTDVAQYGILSKPYQTYMAYDGGNDTLTSITFSPNLNRVARNKLNPVDLVFEDEYKGGALFIGSISSSLNDGPIPPTSFSSILVHDPCSSETNTWIQDVVPGPAYSLVADMNMNLLVQNGDNGFMSMSFVTIPGLATASALILNSAYGCKGGLGLFFRILEDILAIAVVILIGVAMDTGIGELAEANDVLIGAIEDERSEVVLLKAEQAGELVCKPEGLTEDDVRARWKFEDRKRVGDSEKDIKNELLDSKHSIHQKYYNNDPYKLRYKEVKERVWTRGVRYVCINERKNDKNAFRFREFKADILTKRPDDIYERFDIPEVSELCEDEE